MLCLVLRQRRSDLNRELGGLVLVEPLAPLYLSGLYLCGSLLFSLKFTLFSQSLSDLVVLLIPLESKVQTLAFYEHPVKQLSLLIWHVEWIDKVSDSFSGFFLDLVPDQIEQGREDVSLVWVLLL